MSRIWDDDMLDDCIPCMSCGADAEKVVNVNSKLICLECVFGKDETK